MKRYFIVISLFSGSVQGLSSSVSMTVKETQSLSYDLFHPTQDMIKEILVKSGIPDPKPMKLGFSKGNFGSKQAFLTEEERNLAEQEGVSQSPKSQDFKQKTREVVDNVSEEDVQKVVGSAGDTAQEIANNETVQKSCWKCYECD